MFRRHLALCRECHGTGGTIRQDRGVGRKRHAVGASARRRRVEAERPVGSKTKRRCGASAKTTRFFPPSGDERLSRASRRDTEKVRDSPRCAVRISWKVARVTRGGMRSLSCACACVCAASPDSTSFFQSRPAKDTRVKNPQIYLRLSLVLTWLFLCLVNRPSILGSRWYRLRKTTIRGIGRDILQIISPVSGSLSF